ncbi:peptidase associated/transthyretin-like domain-containing protein [Aquimarina rhabdastrellae]
MRVLILFLLLVSLKGYTQLVQIVDKDQKQPVSYATISFGNGNGIFADSQGKFFFLKKLYADIDTLYISSIGYQDLKIATKQLPKQLFLTPEVSSLKEVYITAKKKGKYTIKKIDAKAHNDYFKSWLPTVESEIAVYFPYQEEKSSKIASIFFPIKKEESRTHKGKNASFSTLFKLQFYQNDHGQPGQRLFYDNIFFTVTHKDKSIFELDISDHEVFIPKEGIFIAIQVLGYTDKKGELQKSPKYHIVKTKRGNVKISTTFRPLLPFTNKFENDRTFVRRIFYKNRTWQKFDSTYSKTNNLVLSKYNNYGMGVKLHLYKD